MAEQPAAPPLPDGAPEEIREFASCRRETLELSEGVFGWLPLPRGVRRLVGSWVEPKVTAAPLEPDAARLRVGWGPVGMTIDVVLDDGLLEVTFPESWNPLLGGLQDSIRAWIDDANQALVANGRRLDRIEVLEGVTRITKTPRDG